MHATLNLAFSQQTRRNSGNNLLPFYGCFPFLVYG